MTMEFKVISKQLMVTRWNKSSAWRVETNIFELVKAFLLWNYKADMLPMFPPFIDEATYPQLKEWYITISRPNPPLTRRVLTTDLLYREWLRELDLSKKFNQSECDHYFVDELSTKKVVVEIDEVEASMESLAAS